MEGFNSIENTRPDVYGKRKPDCGLKSNCCVIITDLELQFTEVTLPLRSKVVVTLEKQKQNKTNSESSSLNVFLVSL